MVGVIPFLCLDSVSIQLDGGRHEEACLDEALRQSAGSGE
jgi:hypothetical protein